MYHGKLLNLNWKFRQGFDPACITTPGETDYEDVHIPHTVQEIPYDCFDQYMTCMISTYVKYFQLGQEEISGKRVLLTLEGVSAYYDLYLNGKLAGSHKGAYSMALFDVTDYVQAGENRMVLMVDSNERKDIPPNGSTVDYLIYGGIYRDVRLFIQDEVYIRQELARYEMNDTEEEVEFAPELLMTNQGEEKDLIVKTTIFEEGADGTEKEAFSEEEKPVWQDEQQVHVPEGKNTIYLETRILPQVKRWTLESPEMYRVETLLCKEDGTVVDRFVAHTGFRTVTVTADGFYLNGEKIVLNGLNRHQSFPYVGYALGKRAQEKDARLLKEFMGLNMVRCSHYMQSEYFLNCCDRIGLMVFEEIPGWGFIGDEEFKKVVFQDLENMVLGHFNHPGIVIWGTRLNETIDCDELYEETNRRCKKMDPSRPTTGVRWETGSHLIEDIYSYNDYTEDDKGEFRILTAQQAAERPDPIPYLISEHTGAILPTKPGDSEERREQFAIRHARVMGRVRTTKGYLGALGWCMCDYNTHNDHNSMNKVCYHGVLDMFRVPKWAAYVYASQKSPEQEIVLEPCSAVGRGERCEPVPFYVLTNCDYIEVTFSKDITRAYYPSMKFPGLEHPPIEVTENGEFWQHRWEGSKIVGYVNGKPVAERIYSNNPYLAEYKIVADDLTLYNDRVEETRVVVYALDENGNRLYCHHGVASIEVQGDLELIGPQYLSFMGGAVAFWVKTKATGKAGTGTITVKGQAPLKDHKKNEQSIEIELI